MLATTLVENGLILTMDQDRRVIEGSVLIEGSEIKKVGDFDAESAERVIDAEGKIVMPGLVCTHTRPYRILLQAASLNNNGYSDYMQVLQNVEWPMDEELSADDTYAGTLAACLNFIKSGVTFISCVHSSQEDIGKSLDQVLSALEDSGLRGIIGFEATERHTRAQGARGMRENIRFLENLQKRDVAERKIEGMVPLGLSINVSDELLRHGNRVSNRFDVPMVIPSGKGKVDHYHNLEKFGKRTIERFRDLNILSSDTVLTHCLDLSEDEMSIIDRVGAKVSHDPIGDSLNSLGVAPVPAMRKLGISVGIGNDGYCFDGFRNLRYMHLLHKLNSGNRLTTSSMEALEMATREGAKLYGNEDKIGSVEPGKKADLVVVDSSNLPTPVTRKNAPKHIICAAGRSDVETVMVGGEILMKNGRIKTLDEKRVIEKSKQSAEKIWKSLKGLRR